MKIHVKGDSFEIAYRNLRILHQKDNPWVFCGKGNASYEMFHGNFSIEDDLFSKIPLRNFSVYDNKIVFENLLSVTIENFNDVLQMRFQPIDGTLNRLWLRLPLTSQEHIYGCGEQYSHFDLRGKKVPLWVSEQGVGRNKKRSGNLLC